MGDRCYDGATANDIAAMASITRSGMAAGALGFTTSRFYGHLDKAGSQVPGTNATADEIMTIGEALAELDHGTMEIITDHLDQPDEQYWIEHIARQTGRPVTALVASNVSEKVWDLAERLPYRRPCRQFWPLASAAPRTRSP